MLYGLYAEKKYGQLDKEGLAIVFGVKKVYFYFLGRILDAYDYTISYKPGERHANANSLSRLPLPTTPTEICPPPELVLLMKSLQESPITAHDSRKWTDQDPLLLRVWNLLLNGWRDGEETEMQVFTGREMNSLSRMDVFCGVAVLSFQLQDKATPLNNYMIACHA